MDTLKHLVDQTEKTVHSQNGGLRISKKIINKAMKRRMLEENRRKMQEEARMAKSQKRHKLIKVKVNNASVKRPTRIDKRAVEAKELDKRYLQTVEYWKKRKDDDR